MSLLLLPHIRRLPGRPGRLPDRAWVRASRHLRPLRRHLARWQLERVPDEVVLDLPPIDLPPSKLLPEPLVPAAERILAEADEVLAHRMRFVSSESHQYGNPIEWSRDPLTGYEWPVAWFGSIPFGQPDQGRDVIRVWELSRGHHFLTLARASRLDPERSGEYLAELSTQIEDWIGANPVGWSVNWGNAMEAAIRATNWVWAIRVAGPDRLPDPTIALATRSLQQHARFIRSSLEGNPWRRGNHYVADLMGLAVLGRALRSDPEAARWRADARRLLEAEATEQVLDDGLSFESSSCYQGVVLEMATIAIDALDGSGVGFAPDPRDRFARMIEAAVAIRHPDGRAAQYGDSDSGRILPGGFDREPTLDPVIWTASALLGTGRPLAGDPDPEIAWNLGLDRWQAVAGAGDLAGDPPLSLPNGGIEILEGPAGKVVVNCTPVGQRGNGGHAHSDALSFEWSANGRTVVVDPGTWCYTASSTERDSMRSTACHPTPMVDGEEINPILPGRTFWLTDTGRPKVIERIDLETETTLRCAHPGYERLDPPVSITREFRFEKSSGDLVVVDRLTGSGLHTWSIPVPFGPEWNLGLAGEGRARATGPDGEVEIGFEGPGSLEAEEYWYSPGYGVKETAWRLVFSGVGPLPATITMRARLA